MSNLNIIGASCSTYGHSMDTSDILWSLCVNESYIYFDKVIQMRHCKVTVKSYSCFLSFHRYVQYQNFILSGFILPEQLFIKA